jgi:hypothetical protein
MHQRYGARPTEEAVSITNDRRLKRNEAQTNAAAVTSVEAAAL